MLFYIYPHVNLHMLFVLCPSSMTMVWQKRTWNDNDRLSYFRKHWNWRCLIQGVDISVVWSYVVEETRTQRKNTNLGRVNQYTATCRYLESNPGCSDCKWPFWTPALCTVMILSFRTDMPGQTVQPQWSSLIKVCTVFHSVCIVWTHYSMVEPHSSNFRVITTNILGVRIFRKFTVATCIVI